MQADETMRDPHLSAAPEDGQQGLFAPGRRALSVGAVALVSMVAFEAIAVAAAMPAVAAALNGLDLYALSFGGATATSMFSLVVGGADCDRHGPYRAMRLGIMLLGLGLLVAGLAPTMEWLVLGRIIQGFGFGMISVSIYVAMGRLLPPDLRPRLFAAFAAAWVVPAIVGPALAGLLVETVGWRWVFLLVAILLLPCAAVLLPPISRLAPPQPGPVTDAARPTARRWLWAGLAALGALWLHHATQASDRSDAGGMALACLIVLIAAHRLLPRGSLRSARGLPTVIALRGLIAAAFLSAEVFIPLWLTSVRGWSIAEAGVALSTGALCWSLGSNLQARMHDPAHRLVWLQRGFALVAVGIGGVAALVTSGFEPGWIIPCWAVTGLGIGIAFPMLSVLTLQLSPEHQQGANSSALQLSDAIATTCLLAADGALFATLHASHPELAFVGVFVLAAGLGALGAVLAGRCASPPAATA